MNVGDPYERQRILQPKTYYGHQVYQDSDNGGILIKKGPNGDWTPVDSIDHDLNGKELMADYGLWFDKQVVTGHLWNKHVEREVDGQIQPDEVAPFADQAQTQELPDGDSKCWDTLQLKDVNIQAPNGLGNAAYESSWVVTSQRPLAPAMML